MHSAPPVLVPVGRFVWGARIALALALLSALALGAWLWQVGAGGQQALRLLLAWIALAVFSVWAVRRQAWPTGQLRWDGTAWWFQGEGPVPALPVGVRAVWDGGPAICLHLQAGERGAQRQQGYVCLRARDMPHAWHGLRCAVYQGDTL